MKRPLESRSSDKACMAQEVGVRPESCTTAVPSLIFSVCAPIQHRGVKASLPQASADQTESKPSFSASWAISTKLGLGAALQ